MGTIKYDENADLSKFLEEVLPQIYEKKIESLVICASMENGEIGSAYFNCSMKTKLMYAGLINQDAMMDTLMANGIIEYDDDDVDDDVDESDDPI